VIRDSRIRGPVGAAINFAVDNPGRGPRHQLLSNLPGTPPGEVPVGAPVRLIFEQTSTGQMNPEWRVVTSPRGSYGNGAQHRGQEGAEMADTSWMRNREGMESGSTAAKVAIVVGASPYGPALGRR